MTTTVSLYNVLTEDITTRLIDQLVTNVSDDTKVELSDGLLKGLPTDTRMLLIVRTGDSQWKHTLNIPSENVGMTAPYGDIGGNLYWRERFIVEIDLYFGAAVSQANAKRIAAVVLSRARWSLQNKDVGTGQWWFTTTPDDFGEKASAIQVMDAWMLESGSTGKWIWRGEIRLEILTENEGCV